MTNVTEFGDPDHGSAAQVGDLVKIITPWKRATAFIGIVYATEKSESHPVTRYLWISGFSTRVRDGLVQILSKAS
tara:strand:- start:986 stop:1210 length:225 start_codon:yes stop_codon:yes gene_type:complete